MQAGVVTPMPTPTCHVGTSGWNYKHWSGGRFYPPRLAARNWLAFYATHFDTVEVNNSFYRIPSAESVASWAATVPAHFTFAMKIWRGITHYRKLVNCEEFLDRFFAAANALNPPRRGPLLLQLPPSLGIDVGRLDAFLDAFHAATGTQRWLLAVEFRHPSWLKPEVYALLDRHKVALALADMERCPITEPNGADFVYVRRHGPTGRYAGCYAPEHIAADAQRIDRWLRTGRSVFVYYNNDIGGHAVDNARQLMEALGIEHPPVANVQPRDATLFD